MIKPYHMNLYFLILVISVTTAAFGKELETPEIWTPEKSVKFAIAHSPDSRIALQRMKIAQAVITQAKAGYYPYVNLSSQYGQTNNPMYSFGNILNQGTFTPAMDFNNPGRTDDLNLRAEVGYSFYNGGKDQANIEAAEATFAQSQTERETIYATLAFEVIRSFQAIVQAQEMLDARKAALTAIQASVSVAQARYNAGDLLKVDLLNLEVQESRASENLILAEHQLELSRKIFLNLLGLKEGTVQIDPTFDDQQQLPQERSYNQRPELQSLQHAREAAIARLHIAQGGDLPTVDGFASYQYDKGYVINGDGDSWMAGIKINYRLFEGHRTSADRAKAMAELAAVKARLKKTELRIDLEVKQADLNYHQAVQRLEVTRKMVEQAQESARLNRTRFREGVILSSDLIDVEMRLTDALVRQSIARANIKITSADLRRAMGLQQFAETTEVVEQ
jgi:outer membrane protein TolC